MEQEHTNEKNVSAPATPAADPKDTVAQPQSGQLERGLDRSGSRGRKGKGGNGRGGDRRAGGKSVRSERVKPEYDQKSIDVRRVARVVAGGRRFSFSVAMIVGDRQGKVGVGTGKASDVSLAMDKAVKDAKKHMITVPMTKSKSIAHKVSAKYSSASVVIMPTPERGLIAGSAVRNVLALAGITDVSAKVHSGSKNRLNMARATIKALTMIRPRQKREQAA
jgi:small subunit ribosomal protein S5